MALIPNPLIIPVGLIIGILVAAPVGPVNVLCIQRAIERGFWGGVAAGLGSVLGDGLIALCAALSVNAISGAFDYYRTAIQIVGGIAVIGFGLMLIYARPRLAPVTRASYKIPSLGDYVWEVPKTFFLTITNPGAVLGLIAIFGGVSTFVEVKTYVDVFAMVAAIMTGSLGWWIALSELISRIRHKLSVDTLKRINCVAGLLLIGFGLLLIGEMIVKRLVWHAFG